MLTRAINDGPLLMAQFSFDGSIAVNKYDLLFLDTDDVKPMAEYSVGANEAADQAAIAPIFAGLSGEYREATDEATSTAFSVITDLIVDIDCVSATFEHGDKVTVTRDGGASVVSAKVKKTSTKEDAIGYVVGRYASATTRVKARLMSRVLPHDPTL